MKLKPCDLEAAYLAHAACDREAADLEPLANVRRKHLNSATAWQGLAAMAHQVVAERALRPLNEAADACCS